MSTLLDFVIDAASSNGFTFVYQTVTAGTATPVDLTGYTATMKFGTAYSVAAASLTLTSPSGGIVITGATGTIAVTITKAQSLTLLAAASNNLMACTLDITPSGGEPMRIARGMVPILPAVVNA